MPPNQANKVGEAFIEVTGKVNIDGAVKQAAGQIKNDLQPAVNQTGEALDRMGQRGESAFRRLANSIRGGFAGVSSAIGGVGGGIARAAGIELGGPGFGALGGLGRLGPIGTGIVGGVGAAFGIERLLQGIENITEQQKDTYRNIARRGQEVQEALIQRPPGFENEYRIRDTLRRQAEELDQEVRQEEGYGTRILRELFSNPFTGETSAIGRALGVEGTNEAARRLNRARRLQGVNARRIEEARQLDFNERVGASVIGTLDSVNGQTIGPGQTPDAAFADLVKLTRSMLDELKAMRRDN